MVYPSRCENNGQCLKTGWKGLLFISVNKNMKKILFIEDEMRFQKVLEKVFKEEKLELFSAYDGLTGINMAEEKKPDLILLDLILPKKDGFEVLRELKSNSDTADIPVIVLTNLEGAHNVERALSLGAYMYLLKANYSPEEIMEKIREILG